MPRLCRFFCRITTASTSKSLRWNELCSFGPNGIQQVDLVSSGPNSKEADSLALDNMSMWRHIATMSCRENEKKRRRLLTSPF